MVVRQFMLPSDSLSNMVSLLSLVTDTHISRHAGERHADRTLTHVEKLLIFH